MKAYRRFYMLLLFSYMTIGAMVLTVNTAMPAVALEYGWTDAQGGFLITCLSLGNVTASLLTGIVAIRAGFRKALAVCGLCICGSCALFALVGYAPAFYGFMLIAGLGWGGINNMVNSGISLMYPGSSARLNVGHACYACSAVLFPLLMGFVLLQGMSWRLPVLIVAAMGAVLTAVSTRVPIPVAYRRPEGKSSWTFVREPDFYLGALMFFLYVGVETGACAWLSEWLGRQNAFFQRVPSETMVSLMWLTMIIGRLSLAAVGTRVQANGLLVLLSLGFLLGMLGITFLSQNTVFSVCAVAFMGLSMSGIYAACVACNEKYVAQPLASGLLYGGGGLGAAVVPLAAGAVSDLWGLKAGMETLCICLIGLAGICVTSLLRKGKVSVEDETNLCV